MRIPQIASVKKAAEIYYKNLTLSSKDIGELFGGIGHDKIAQLKRIAKEQMEKDGIPSYNAFDVSTIAAFKAWGIDVEELTKRYQTAKRLRLGE